MTAQATKLGVFQGLAGQWVTVYETPDGVFTEDRGMFWPMKKDKALERIADQREADAKRKAWLLNKMRNN